MQQANCSCQSYSLKVRYLWERGLEEAEQQDVVRQAMYSLPVSQRTLGALPQRLSFECPAVVTATAPLVSALCRGKPTTLQWICNAGDRVHMASKLWQTCLAVTSPVSTSIEHWYFKLAAAAW